jgi:ribose transport system substrate-binding protein
MKIKPLVAAAIFVAAVLALAGCSTTAKPDSASDGPIKVAAFSAGYASPAIKYVVDTFQAQAKDAGWEVQLNTTNDDYDTLNSYMTTAIGQGYNAFFLAGFDPRALSVGIAAANDAGIPVFAIDGDPSANDAFTLDVVSDQNDLADLSVKGLKAALGDLSGKKIVLISFDPSLTISTRTSIMQDSLTAAGANVVDVHKVPNIAASVDDSLAYVKDYLQSHPGGVDAVWAAWAPAALGAFQAVSESGENVTVVSADTMGAINQIIAGGGPFAATAMQDWNTAVGDLVSGMKSYFDSGKVDSNFILVPGIYVDKSNAASVDPGY